MPTRFARYVALGDSTTEGLDDPDGEGGYRGWANRLAEHLAHHQGEIAYANLGVRGRCTREIKEEQLAPALALRPDLASVVVGMNDLLRPTFDAAAIARDLEEMQRALVATGCVVLTFTIPDISRHLAMRPIDRFLSRRTIQLDEEIRRVSHATGARLLDVAAYPLARDPRMWSRDRLHANAEGHRRIAAGLAQLLELPGADTRWQEPLPDEPVRFADKLAGDLAWGREYLLPWLWRQVRGRSAGDGRGPKRPALAPVKAAR